MIVDTIEMTILKPMATKKFSIAKPSTIHEVKTIIRALITILNKPSVMTVIGSDTRRIMGRRNVLKSPSTMVANRSASHVSIATPGST